MPPKGKNEPTDLLGGLADEAAANGNAFDLLDGLSEDDDSEPWMPENAGDGVQGTVLSRSVTRSDYTPEPIPVLVVEQANGSKLRVTGYQSVLRKEIEDADPQPGDLFAAKYFGQKTNKKGTGSYHHFKVAVRRGNGKPAAAAGGPVPF